MSLAAAAAVVLALVAGLVVWTRDDSSNIDTPPAPGAGDNTVVIVQGDHTDAAVTPTAVAGIVSFDITNPTDGYRGVEILPMLPGVTIDDVRAAAAAFVPEVADTSGLLGDAVLGVDDGPAGPLRHGDGAGCRQLRGGLHDQRCDLGTDATP